MNHLQCKCGLGIVGDAVKTRRTNYFHISHEPTGDAYSSRAPDPTSSLLGVRRYSVWCSIATDVLKDYMRSSARLYVRDSNITAPVANVDSRIETFVKDAFDIEYRLAKIDIGSVVKHMFQGAGIDDEYRVVVHKPSVLRQAFDMIDNLGPEKKRMLNNYLIWRAMDRYNHDLSTDYLHVKRLFYAKRTGDKEFPETPLYCLQNVESHFARALGSIFIQDHFVDQNKRELLNLLQSVKEEVISSVKESSLYDDKTKERALKKIRAINVNVGYPEFMMNSTLMDEYYTTLQIDRNDYFANVLTTNSFTMKKFASLLAKRVTDLDMWMYHTYKVNITFDYVWNVLDVPAGLLQFPVYNKYLPHYIRYGAIGIPLAIRFVHAIDMVGGHYDEKGSVKFWFTNVTNKRWQKQIQCMERYFMSKTMGPYQPPGQKQPIMVIFVNEHCLTCPALKQEPRCLPPVDIGGLRPCPINRCKEYPPSLVPKSCYTLGPSLLLSNGLECRGCPSIDPFCRDLKLQLCASQAETCTVLPAEIPLECKTADLIEEAGVPCLSCPKIKDIPACVELLTKPRIDTPPPSPPDKPVPAVLDTCDGVICIPTVGIEEKCLSKAQVIGRSDGTRCLGCRKINASCVDPPLNICPSQYGTCTPIPEERRKDKDCISQQVLYENNAHCLTCEFVIPDCYVSSPPQSACTGLVCDPLPPDTPQECITQEALTYNGEECFCPTRIPGCGENPLSNNPFLQT
ncbi:hypothetical protein FSP39_022416 [Pinctada imbricata]|uniref:Uncharacterized protein n=1 Tax=Pinctada imbricata TaxID=66713 RepID=A0AA88YPI2_PINIB|nr:hypothetical protein FSP39_022416 [Pinctada imbricata]